MLERTTKGTMRTAMNEAVAARGRNLTTRRRLAADAEFIGPLEPVGTERATTSLP